MLRKIGLVLVALVAVVLLGVGFLRFQGAALPGLPAAPLPASLAPAIASGDSVAVASAIRARCRLLLGKYRRHCIEDFLLQLTRAEKVRLAMGALDLVGQHDAGVRRRGHDYSHVIGINAWDPSKDIGAVYLQCTELFQSGCYHGVIQAYFAYNGTDSAHVVGVCRDTPGIKDNGWLHFQCVHGIGHGLVQNFTMRLPRALEGCDMLGNYFDSESCYGGAFMEFIVGGRGQSHHPHLVVAKAAKPAGEMDHDMAGMGDGAMTAESLPPFKVRDRSDLLYPCTVLGDKYQRACYEMQAGLIVEVTGLDFAKVAKVCDTAPERMRPVCYQGIGTYVSGVTARDPEESIRICSLGNPRYRPWCFVGVVKNFIDVTATPDDGIAFCRRLDARDLATSCWVAVGEQVAALYVMMGQRGEACAKSAPEYVEACRFGAGLSTVRPPDLPSKS